MVNVRLFISRSDVRISELAEFLLIRGLFVFFIITIYKTAFFVVFSQLFAKRSFAFIFNCQFSKIEESIVHNRRYS